jgi:hypothetical protein
MTLLLSLPRHLTQPMLPLLCRAVLCSAPEPILLDGLLQAVTMKTGDVVAVRTAARPMPTYFGCFDHQMQLNPRSIHRPVLAAVVEVGGLCRPYTPFQTLLMACGSRLFTVTSLWTSL